MRLVFHFILRCLAQSNYIAILLIQYKYEREHDKAASLVVKKHRQCVSDVIYRTEGNLGGGKIWRIHYKNTFGERKFGKFLILRRSSKNINFINGHLRCQMCKDSEDGDIHVFI